MGPIVMAELVHLLGPSGLFYGNAGFLIVLAAITRFRIMQTDDVPVAEQEHFVPAMPEASAVLSEIDPRNEAFCESPEAEAMQEEMRHGH